MRASFALLSTAVLLLASNNGLVAAAEINPMAKNEASTEAPVFVQVIPFKCGNVSGNMVITIDKASLHEVSATSTSDSSDVYDFTQLDKAAPASKEEERGLFSFGISEFVNYKITSGVVSWVKKVF